MPLPRHCSKCRKTIDEVDASLTCQGPMCWDCREDALESLRISPTQDWDNRKNEVRLRTSRVPHWAMRRNSVA
jgi:hypothetical protein